MIDRRDFVKHTLAATVSASALLHAADVPALEPTLAVTASPIDIVIFDAEFADSVVFKDALVAKGSKAFAIQDDLGRLWHGPLGELFTQGASMAGLTTHSDLFVCESFARMRGARLRFEGQHDCRSTDILTHSLRCSTAVAPVSTALATAGDEWASLLGGRLSAFDRSHTLDTRIETNSQSVRHASNPGSLFSWVLA